MSFICILYYIRHVTNKYIQNVYISVISCPVPDLVGNGSVTPVSPVYLPSTVITYQCDPGFVLTGGSTSRTCNSNGVWDGVPPACTGSKDSFSVM